jgi:Secretion system C-terminal sorting domain
MLQLSTNPVTFSLLQNYPNPFNPSTTISFSLLSKSIVSLKIFDLTGKEIATIDSQELSSGTYWRQWYAANMSSGVYFFQLRAGTITETKRLVLLR